VCQTHPLMVCSHVRHIIQSGIVLCLLDLLKQSHVVGMFDCDSLE